MNDIDGIKLIDRDYRILKELEDNTGYSPSYAEYLDDYMTIGFYTSENRVVDLVINNFHRKFIPFLPIRDLDYHGFKQFPLEVFGLQDLYRIGILGFTMINLKGIENLNSLEILIIRECNNVELPESLKKLKKLEELEVSYSDLKFIPNIIRDISSLKKLNLEGNQITLIPKFIGNLQNLEELNLCDNPIVKIPKWLDKHILK
ncbi:MAG: leucine-rich repeat domain-containing protein [Promethearchaeota archaeon]